MSGKTNAASLLPHSKNSVKPESEFKKSAPDFKGMLKVFSGEEIGFNNASKAIETPIDFEKNVFIPTWANKPEEVKPIMSYNGSPILTFQNTSAIIAAPGMGKSSLVEAAAASYLNPECDALGWEISSECEGILIIDNERTTQDVWNSFARMCKRAGVSYGSEVNKVTMAGLRAIPRLKERIAAIEHLLQQKLYSLLILDGAGDMVTDSNDLLQAIDCRIWLRELTVRYNLSILTTLHPNPNSNKPRGHIGSEVHRECECVLLAKNVEGEIRVLTSDFEHGKNRNHANVTGAYRWSDEHKMFISADIDSIAEVKERAKGTRKRNESERLFLKVIAPPKSMSYTDLCASIMDEEDCSEPTAKRKVREMTDFGLIKKHDDGLYRAI